MNDGKWLFGAGKKDVVTTPTFPVSLIVESDKFEGTPVFTGIGTDVQRSEKKKGQDIKEIQ